MTEEIQEVKKRILWLDHARGFVMMLLVITMYLPKWIREGPARFFIEHPESQTTTTVMNFYDIGAPAFIVIMGFLMPLSFFKRKERDGTTKAVKHVLIRYGIILGLGLLIFIPDGGTFIKIRDGEPVIVAGMMVMRWDVLPTLGLVGFVALPTLFVNPKIRALIASGMLIFYQIMVSYFGWREHAIESIHGGILGTLFGFSALMIWATCIGEFMFLNEDKDENQKLKLFALVGMIFFVGGLLLTIIPGWYPNKRQVTLTYILISFGAAILISFVFIAIEKTYQKPIILLDSYGKNFFITYIIAIVVEFLIDDIIGYEIDLFLGLIIIAIISFFLVILDKREIIIKL